MFKKTAVVVFAGLMAGAAFAGDVPKIIAKPKPSGPKIVGASSNDFALKLYAELAGKDANNLFLSPASIHSALTMTYAGAGGDTAKQMAETLALPKTDDWEAFHNNYAELIKLLNNPPKDSKDKPAYELSVANSLWGQKGLAFLEPFMATLESGYGAALRQLNFQDCEPARKTINDWVSDKTKDKIKDLLQKGLITPQTCLVLVNAIYFKSDWLVQFEKRNTTDGEFKASADKSARVPMMHRQGRYDYFENEDFQAIELPYAGEQLSMMVLLPKKADGLAKLEKDPAAAMKSIKPQQAEVRVTLPRFKITAQFRLDETLKAMGMKDAFSGAADFSHMTKAAKLFISAVVHKAYVAVDEAGTEAAAATAVVMDRSAHLPDPNPKIFTADHPFIFLIRHKDSKTLLFMGRVANPAE